MRVHARDIVTAVRHGEASLVGESCGYVVLGAADHAARSPQFAHFDSVAITSDGEVTLEGPVCTAADAEFALRALLGQLLRFVRTPCPNLQRVAERSELKGVATLVLELEAALVPVNRRAARRSLSRLWRETTRSAQQLRARAEVEPVEITSSLPPPSPTAPVEEGHFVPTACAVVVPAVENMPDLAGVPVSTNIEPEPARSEFVVQFVQTSAPRAVSHEPGWASVIASHFVEQTPIPLMQPSTLQSERDVFDELLDECPTQIFRGEVAQISHVGRTLTPPPPVDEEPVELEHISVETPIAREMVVVPPSATEPELLTAPDQPDHVAWTALVVAPAVDPLILSPCPPPVEAAPRRVQPFYRYRARPRAPISENVSLLPDAPLSADERPSEIEDLLNRFLPADRPQDELVQQLQLLSRVDLTPSIAAVQLTPSGE